MNRSAVYACCNVRRTRGGLSLNDTIVVELGKKKNIFVCEWSGLESELELHPNFVPLMQWTCFINDSVYLIAKQSTVITAFFSTYILLTAFLNADKRRKCVWNGNVICILDGTTRPAGGSRGWQIIEDHRLDWRTNSKNIARGRVQHLHSFVQICGTEWSPRNWDEIMTCRSCRK